METRSHVARMWRIIRDEAREAVWLVSVIGALSILSAAVAVAFVASQ